MKSILVPTDFSETSGKAARYAIHFAQQLKYEKIILFNACERYIETDATLPVVVQDFSKEAIEASKEALEKLKRTLLPFTKDSLAIETYCLYGYLTDEINDAAKKFGCDFIVMGVTGSDKIGETFIGSFAIDVSRTSEVPVIIVPPEAGFTPIEEIMFACDFESVNYTTPVDALKNLLNATGSKLFVLNVNKDKNTYAAGTQMKTAVMDELLNGYKPEYHFIGKGDFVEDINEFALQKEVDLIITIPKKQGLFEGLFAKNTTKMLAFHSHVPLMVLHD